MQVQKAVRKMKTLRRVLGNGIRVSAYSFPQLETVAMSLGVRLGSIDERPSINGAAHFLEHMLFKGTGKRTWKEIDDQLKSLGARYNAFTDHETTVYFVQVYKGYFEKAMEILSDMIRHSTIPEKEVELERGPVINENMIHNDNPKYMISDYIPRVLYRKHPARMPVGGDNEKTIRNVGREDLLSLYKTYYTPRNSVLSIYGGIEAGRAFATAEKYFGGAGNAFTKPRRSISKEVQRKRIMTVERKGIKQTRIGIGFMCGEYRSRDVNEFVSLSVIERYLGDKLFEEIREKRGLSYDPLASYSPYSTFGFIAAAVGVEPKNLGKAKEIMLEEFKKLQEGEIDHKEFERTKRALSIEARMRREDSMEMAVYMSTFELMYGGTALLDSMSGLISKVRVEEAKRYCSKYIDVERYGMAVLKPAE